MNELKMMSCPSDISIVQVLHELLRSVLNSEVKNVLSIILVYSFCLVVSKYYDDPVNYKI